MNELSTLLTNYNQRLSLESWYTSLEHTPIIKQISAPYKRLIHDVDFKQKPTKSDAGLTNEDQIKLDNN